MRVGICIFFILLLSCSHGLAQPAPQWLDTLKTNSGVEIMNVATDAYQNVYVCGSFGGTMDFGSSIVLRSNGPTDAFAAKYTRSGSVLYAVNIGGGLDDKALSLVVDRAGICYVAGVSSDSASFGSAGIIDHGFVAQISPVGKINWRIESANRKPVSFQSISIDRLGSKLIVTGTAQDSMMLGNQTTNGLANSTDALVALLDSSGTVRWLKRSTGPKKLTQSIDQASSAVFGVDGSVYVTGAYVDSLHFDSVSLFSYPPKSYAYLAKLNISGDALWLRTLVPLGTKGTSIALDSAGKVYVSGDHCFCMKIEPDGTVDKTVQNEIPGLGAASIQLSSEGSILIAGILDRSLRYQGLGRGKGDSADVYLLKLDSQFHPLWATTFGSTIGLSSIRCALDESGNNYCAGSFLDTIRVGQFMSVSGPVLNGFLTNFAEHLVRIDSISSSVICPGDSMNVVFTARGEFANVNTFTAQISDSSGSFRTPTDLGSVAGKASDSILVRIPYSLTASEHYRLRVISNYPKAELLGVSAPIVIRGVPGARLNKTGQVNICESDSTILRAIGGYAYRWNTGDTTAAIVVHTGGIYSVVVSGPPDKYGPGCSIPLPPVTVVAHRLPPVPAIFLNGNELSSNSDAGNQWNFNGKAIPGATQKTLTVTDDGNYSVTVTDEFGCSEISDVIVISRSSVTEATYAESVELEGNPYSNTSMFRFNATVPSRVRIEFLNVIGEPACEPLLTNVSVGTTEFPIGAYLKKSPAGAYFIRVEQMTPQSALFKTFRLIKNNR